MKPTTPPAAQKPSRLPLPLWTQTHAAPLAPTSRAEMAARGWDAVDVVFVTGDAYVDHPSFAMAILHRVLEAAGFRVAMLSQPDWRSCEPWRQFGRPRLFFAVSAGNMDSLINHRSEEHTSELQSLRHLVCRLLLEKKKKKHNTKMLIDHKNNIHSDQLVQMTAAHT